MATHKLDKFFNEKLMAMEQVLNPAAWTEIDEKLEDVGSKNIWLWLGIAASAALVLVSSWYLLNVNEGMPEQQYSYAQTETLDANVPVKVVLVPLIIQVRYINENINQDAQLPNRIAETKPKNLELNNEQKPILVADNTVLQPQLKPVIQQPLPVGEELNRDLIVASTIDLPEQLPEVTQFPLTIIYKQGEVENKSKFNQAMSYLEDVRSGNKKLVNFKKIKDNIQSKLKLNKETKSK